MLRILTSDAAFYNRSAPLPSPIKSAGHFPNGAVEEAEALLLLRVDQELLETIPSSAVPFDGDEVFSLEASRKYRARFARRLLDRQCFRVSGLFRISAR